MEGHEDSYVHCEVTLCQFKWEKYGTDVSGYIWECSCVISGGPEGDTNAWMLVWGWVGGSMYIPVRATFAFFNSGATCLRQPLSFLV